MPKLTYMQEWRKRNPGYIYPADTPTHRSWQHMKQRCNDPKSTQYRWYGARGIKVCPEWVNSFSQFLKDMGERPEGHTLDRIDTNGDYTFKNCRWATLKQQSDNRRNPSEAMKKYKASMRG